MLTNRRNRFRARRVRRTITVCDPTDIVAAKNVNAEVCGCGALFLYVRLMRRRYIPTGAKVNR